MYFAFEALSEQGYLKCRDENLITDNGTRIPVRCDTNGNFEVPSNASWPVRRISKCSKNVFDLEHQKEADLTIMIITGVSHAHV